MNLLLYKKLIYSCFDSNIIFNFACLFALRFRYQSSASPQSTRLWLKTKVVLIKILQLLYVGQQQLTVNSSRSSSCNCPSRCMQLEVEKKTQKYNNKKLNLIMLKVRCTRRTTSASASSSATTRSPFTRCTLLLWGLLLTAPAKRAHGNYFNCMHLKARQQKTREPEGVRESGAGWEREYERGKEGKRKRNEHFKKTSSGSQSTVQRQVPHSEPAAAVGRGWGGVRHSYATVVAHRSSTRPFE